jgi:phage tail-like protein
MFRTKKNLYYYVIVPVLVLAFQLFIPADGPAPTTIDTGREDPLVGFHYALEADGLTAYFTSVSGIGSENEITEQKVVSSKGVQTVQKIPGRLKWLDVTLSRGITNDLQMWEWRNMVETGNIKNARKNVSIIMYNQQLEPVAQWDFTNAWPSKIEMSSPAGTNETAVEELVLVNEGCKRVKTQ